MNTKIELTSKKFRLNAKDYLRGLLMAVGTAVFTTVEQALNLGTLKINWTGVAAAGIGAGLVYIGKNFFSPAQKKVEITNEEHDELMATSSTEKAAK